MKRLFIATVVLLVAASVFGLTVDRGDLRLVLHESSARFSLFARVGTDSTDGEWLPLFLAEDPRTSTLDILEGNRIHRMGDSGNFTQDAEELEEGARFIWVSPTLRVVQAFRFTRGVTSENYDAVEMTVTVTNTGEEPVLTGVRVLLDTYLGERSNTHFVTPALDQIVRESRLEPGPVNRYVASVETASASHGLQVMLQAEGITPPEAALVANWKRLIDSSWEYEINNTRNFNRLPYSINDSALLLTYEPVQLETSEEHTVVAYLGDLSPEGYLPPSLAAETTGDNPVLARLASLVSEINDLLASGDIDAARVAELQAELQTLTSIVRGR
ncbi:MAG: hypothetical protein ACOCZB_00085 [Spirochaetota bacterium]